MPFLELSNITKTYNPGQENQVEALRGVSLTIEKTEFLAVTGKSGSGKSTLLHILGTLDSATSGTYLLEGREIGKMNDNQIAELRNQEIGFVLQDFGLILSKTAAENVEIPFMFSKTSLRQMKEKVAFALERVGLKDKMNAKANQLSGGQKQRVSIARAIVNQPSLLLADEPTGALDSTTSEHILALLQDLNSQGLTIVLVTHDMQIASSCKSMVTIHDGLLVE